MALRGPFCLIRGDNVTLQEILEEIAEKYPHSLSNDSVVRKINQEQNKLFRTTFKNPTLSVYSLLKNVFAYQIPFPKSSLLEVIVNGDEYNYQSVRRQSNRPYYYFVGANVLAINPTPKEDIADGLTLFHNKYPIQVAVDGLDIVPELDEDFHMLLVYGPLVHIAESFSDVAMVNNFTSKYNGLIEEFEKTTDTMPDYLIIEDVMGGLL